MYHAPLLIDVAGTSLSADDRRRLQSPLVGGVIYFGRNWQSREQISDLSAAIKAIRPDVLITVDHEGGRVQRFRSDGFTHLPPMRALGQHWRKPDRAGQEGRHAMQALQAASACGYVLAAELRACGVDMSFAPVLDLDYGHSSVIGDRAFDGDPRLVALLAKSLMHGLLQAGMAHCGKHFPGHGHVRADSHVAIPVDKRGLRALLNSDALPYQWLLPSLMAVMPAHVIYAKVDERPAGFSPRWLQEVLRGELGFSGAIISDDLSMQGARQIQGRPLSLTEGVLAALDAGCDLTLVCNQSLNGGRALDVLLDEMSEAAVKGRWQPQEASELRRRALLPTAPAVAWDDLMRSPAYIQALEMLALLSA
ncbi:MAG: beta-N-acetylhexosaminidase [Brachymonas sp.]|nr:beta-N-acetylhexosaminidase [Brachymonas sp.]